MANGNPPHRAIPAAPIVGDDVVMQPSPLLEDDSAMVLSLPTYAETRDSGVEWLGDVPAHWEVRRIKDWLRVNQTVLPEDTDPDYEFHYIDIGAVQAGVLVGDPVRMRFGTSPSRARRVLRGGDTIVSTVRTYLKAVLHVPAGGDDLVASTGFAVLTPQAATEPAFVGSLCRSQPFTDFVMAQSVGVAYPAIAETRLSAVPVAIPPLEEQTAIVRFLDYVDRRIRQYIRAKEKLIAALEEQKQAVIHQAVTGQIDVRTGEPYPAYRESGLDWLPEVPKHWEVRPSRRVFRPRKELARSGDTQLSATQAYGVIAQAEYEAKIGRKVTKITRNLQQRRHVEVDDFVISMRSFQGGLERAWRSGCIRSSYIVLQAAVPLNVDYFGRLFKSRGYIAALQSTANFIRDGQDLSFENFARVHLPFPAPEEQHEIAEAIGRSVRQASSEIEISRRRISLLREYSVRLLADVVTGKLDVRGAAVALPEEEDPLGHSGRDVA
ncbi:MAG: restriction endonuclease subunit S [Acidobacteriota bacterium]|nr:restriction endonuclease subunit S [Acidobacteriota bacterium]